MSSISESAKTAATVSPTEDVVKCEDLIRRPSVPCCNTRTESEILAEFPWEGHWEVWEREWVSARWVWDVRASRVGVSNQQRVEPELSQAHVAAANTTQAPAETPIKAEKKPLTMTADAYSRPPVS
jgi:hypothetical protein